MSNLSVEFLGLKFKNPFWISSGPATMDADHMIRSVKLGWGAAVSKTIGLDHRIVEDVRPRLSACKVGDYLVYLQNIEQITTKKTDFWKKEFERYKKECPNDPLIISIMAGYEEEWQKIAQFAIDCGADMLELNFGCPHEHFKDMGAAVGQSAKLTLSCTKAVREITDMPLLVKITPNVTDPVEIAKAAKQGGADGITAINTVLGLSGIDINTGTPLPSIKGYSAFGGHSGPMVRPIGLRVIAQIAKANLGLGLSGVGGIDTWANAIEYIMVGSLTTQVHTVVMKQGFEIITSWLKATESFMKEQGYDSIDEMKGLSLKYLKEMAELKVDLGVMAQVDINRCNNCRLCVTACKDGASGSMQEPSRNGNDIEKCVGCSLCEMVCPQNAIEMVNISTQRKEIPGRKLTRPWVSP